MCNRRISRRSFLCSLAGGAAATAASGLLAACAPATTPQVGEESVSVESPAAPTPDSSRPTTIYFLTQSVTPDTLSQLSPLIASFEEAHPDIRIQFAVQPGTGTNIYQKMVIMQQGGTPADMAVWANRVAPNACRGVFRDMKPYAEADAFDFSDYYENHIRSLYWQDGLYGMPAAVYTTCMYFNKDIFDAAGMKYPPQSESDVADFTMESYLEMLQSLTVQGADGRPSQFGLDIMYMNWNNRVQFYGGYEISSDFTQSLLDTPESKAGLAFFSDVSNSYHVAPSKAEAEALAGGVTAAEARMLSGKVATAIGGNWSLPSYVGADFNWDVAIQPSSAPEGNRSANFSPDAFVMGMGPNPDKVWQFFKWIQEPDNIKDWCLTVGAFSPRKQHQEYNANLVGDRFGVTGDVFNYCLANSTMVNGRLREYGSPNEEEITNLATPLFDELDLGRITVDELVTELGPKMVELAQKGC